MAKGKGIDYLELGMFALIAYVAWKVFLKDLVDEGIGKLKSSFPAQTEGPGINMTEKEDSWLDE